MNFNIVSGQYHTIHCDLCGIEIEKHSVPRLRHKLEGKKNFCGNICKFEFSRKH
jgi:hypothetical protein